MSQKIQRDEIETRSMIIALLKKGIGFGIEIFGLLSIDTLENGDVRVMNQLNDEGHIEDGVEKIFAAKDVKKAVDYFLAIRRKRKLGFDLF